MNGFKVDYELVFLRNIKKCLLEMKPEEMGNLSAMLEMFGPAFALTSNSSIDLKFNDFEEIEEHPYSKHLLVSLN